MTLYFICPECGAVAERELPPEGELVMCSDGDLPVAMVALGGTEPAL